MTGTQIYSHPMRIPLPLFVALTGFLLFNNACVSLFFPPDGFLDSIILSIPHRRTPLVARHKSGMESSWMMTSHESRPSPTHRVLPMGGWSEYSLLRLLIPRLRSLVSHPREPIEHVFEWVRTHTERESRWIGSQASVLHVRHFVCSSVGKTVTEWSWVRELMGSLSGWSVLEQSEFVFQGVAL